MTLYGSQPIFALMDHSVHFGRCLEAHNFICVQVMVWKLILQIGYIRLALSESAVRIELGCVDHKLQAFQNQIFVRRSIYMSHFDYQL